MALLTERTTLFVAMVAMESGSRPPREVERGSAAGVGVDEPPKIEPQNPPPLEDWGAPVGGGVC